MLSFQELNETEIIFLAIDTNLLSEQLCDAMIHQIFLVNREAHIYLTWLLTRWRLLREDKSHLPEVAKRQISIHELIK
jgi:hypothetical protein